MLFLLIQYFPIDQILWNRHLQHSRQKSSTVRISSTQTTHTYTKTPQQGKKKTQPVWIALDWATLTLSSLSPLLQTHVLSHHKNFQFELQFVHQNHNVLVPLWMYVQSSKVCLRLGLRSQFLHIKKINLFSLLLSSTGKKNLRRVCVCVRGRQREAEGTLWKSVYVSGLFLWRWPYARHIPKVMGHNKRKWDR